MTSLSTSVAAGADFQAPTLGFIAAAISSAKQLNIVPEPLTKAKYLGEPVMVLLGSIFSLTSLMILTGFWGLTGSGSLMLFAISACFLPGNTFAVLTAA